MYGPRSCQQVSIYTVYIYIIFLFQNCTDVKIFISAICIFSYKFLLEASVTDLNASAVDILDVDDRVNFVKTEDAVRNLLFTGHFHFYCCSYTYIIQ